MPVPDCAVPPLRSAYIKAVASLVRLLPVMIIAGNVWATSGFPIRNCQDRLESDAVAESGFEDAEMPITQIVFFNTGIAQFIHSGTLAGNRRLQLEFAGNNIDDVLKSLVFEDSGGGKVQSVEYQTAPGREDIAARQMQPPLTIAQLLQQYRGEKIELTFANSEQVGAIFSVENRQLGRESIESVTLLKEEGLQTFALADVKSIQFQNEALSKEFKLAMVGLAKSRQTDTRSLELRFSGEGERQVRFAYIIDAPIWRMTYRLDAKDAKASLQGWAHIDNVTDSDWRDVQIELRSGRAQAFHANLFDPILGRRPSVGLSIFGIPPTIGVYDPNPSLISRTDSDLSKAGSGGGFGGGGFGGGVGAFGGGRGGGSAGGIGGVPSSELDIRSGVGAVADVGRVERMVTFRVQQPVNLEAGRSAMIPVIIEEIPSTLLTVFEGYSAPTLAQLVTRIENTTGNAIVPGPAAVYRKGNFGKGNFVGDAGMPRVEIHDTSELNYGIDQPVAIDGKAIDSETKIMSARLQNGEILLEQQTTTRHEISLHNKDSRSREILLKLNLGVGTFEPAPEKISDGLTYFRYEINANSRSMKTITQVAVQTQSVPFHKLPENALNTWQRTNVEVAGDLESWLTRIEEIRERRTQAESDLRLLESRLFKADSEQKRLLQLVSALDKVDKPRERFVAKLAEFEIEIEKLRPEVAAALDKVAHIREEFNRSQENTGE